jgi:4'-phosphopantetheinyl transferase
LALAGDEIHLWFFPQWQALNDAASSLPLRTLLAGYLDRDVTAMRIERAEHGKPRVAGEPTLEFNLSHSGGAMLVALSRSQPLGVDIEMPRRTRPVLALARRWFDPIEAAALESLPEADQQAAFLHLWSCKEAVLKALGRGIGFGLDRAAFDMDVAGNITGLRQLDGELTPAAWHLVRLRPAAGWVGALAWRGSTRPIRTWVASLAAIAPRAQSG